MIVVDQIVDKISEVATTIAFRHIGYLYHYNENIQGLEDETEGLKQTLRRFNDVAERDLRNAKDIEPDAEEWQKGAKEMVDEVTTILENKERSNTRFCKCWCPNPTWRYRLSKESTLKRARVKSLNEKGTMFLTELPLSHLAPPPELPLTNQKAFNSRKKIFNGIMKSLNDPTIKMIGVCGAGGVGKTTMVKDVRNRAKRDKLFDDVAFAVVSQKPDKEKVQGELAAQLGLTLDAHGRAEKLSTRLQNGKKNLVILDDVWDPINLEEIGIPTTTGCCKVLITSRKNLFHMMTPKPSDQRAPEARPKVFFIPILKKKEAWTLFERTAEIEDEMLSIAKKVCRECAGLPVAILAVATALKGKEMHAWKDALAQLKRSNLEQIVDIDPTLFSSLKLSYDLLGTDDERSCFLLCSLFPEDAEIAIEDLVRYSFGMRLHGSNMSTKLEDVRNRVLTVVKSLKASCLLLDGKYEYTVKMHDVIRDVAITIAKDKKKYLVKHNLKRWSEGGPYEGYSAVSLMSENFGEIPSELGCKELHTLVLRSKDRSLPDSFFNGMESNLEVLDLSGMTNIRSLPNSLSKLYKLRMLYLPDRVREISLLGKLKSLEILYASSIYKLPLEIRQLTRLKLLDLGNFSNSLSVIPPNVLSNLTSMEELCIPDHYDEWQDEATNKERSNASLVELNSLTSLTSLKVHMPKGKSSPNHLCFEKLDRYRISIGAHLDHHYFRLDRTFIAELFDFDFNDFIARLFNINDFIETKILPTSQLTPLIEISPFSKILQFSEIPLEDKFKVLMVKSEVLVLHKVEGLEEVLHHMDGSGFFNLKYLVVGKCDGGKHLLGRPRQFPKTPQQRMSRSFCNLSRLIVAECTLFKYLFNISVTGRLKHLQELYVSDCSNMKVIVGKGRQGDDEEITFPGLNVISLTGLPNLKSFCSSKRPDSIMGASSSEPAQPLFCEKVVFPRLFQLIIWKLGSVKGIWDRTPPVDSFQQLSSLNLRTCQNLLYVGQSEVLGSLQNLQELHISSCNLLEEVFKSRGSESEEGKVLEHEPTTEEVDTKVVLPRLRNLYLYNLPRLKSFCAGSKLPSSAKRHIINCPLLETHF